MKTKTSIVQVLTILGFCILGALYVGCSLGDGNGTRPSSSAPSIETAVPVGTRGASPTVEKPTRPKPPWWPDEASEGKDRSDALPALRRPSPIPQIQANLHNPIWEVPPTIDEQIFYSDIIVVASFVSAAAGVQAVSVEAGFAPVYWPMQILRFREAEYLKGSGPNEFVVEVADNDDVYQYGEYYEGYLNRDAALDVAVKAVGERNTEYDNRPGVLFLRGPRPAATPPSDEDSGSYGGSAASQSSPVSLSHGFVLSNPFVQTSFEYSVDTLSRTWLPAKGVPGQHYKGGASASAGDREFITDGTKYPTPVMTLTALKTRIEEIADMLAAGEGKEGYRDCIRSKLSRPRYYRNYEGPTFILEATIGTGLAAGTHLYDRQRSKSSGDQYSIYTTSGPDAELFYMPITDDDTDASNGYRYDNATARPLPAGKYSANFHTQHYSYVICDHNPTENNYHTYNVTVEAPAGTVHEAFFDPTEAGTDDVSPTAFTVGGTATEINRLKWNGDEVVLTLDPYVSLVGNALDFIALDGTVSLTLKVAEATVDAETGTLTWAKGTAPWKNGDKLMLRIREDGSAKAPALTSTHTPTRTPIPPDDADTPDDVWEEVIHVERDDDRKAVEALYGSERRDRK